MTTRNSPCACGSGKRFKHCCGALTTTAAPVAGRAAAAGSPYNRIGYFRDEHRGPAMQRFCEDLPAGRAAGMPWVPPGLLIVDGFLDQETCARWRAVFDAQPTKPATVQKLGERDATAAPKFTVDEQRITEFVPLAELSSEVPGRLLAAYQDLITPHFSAKLAWMTKPSVLKYVPGGKYNAHADSEYWDMQQQRWVRSMDRDFSVLLYVNDGYEGGTLYFHNFGLRIKPRRGMLVAFPSDHRFMHSAEPLISGTRYAVVAWGAAEGVPKVSPMPADALTP